MQILCTFILSFGNGLEWTSQGTCSMNDGANSHSDTDLHGSLSYIFDSVAMKTEAVCSSKNLGHTIIT